MTTREKERETLKIEGKEESEKNCLKIVALIFLLVFLQQLFSCLDYFESKVFLSFS